MKGAGLWLALRASFLVLLLALAGCAEQLAAMRGDNDTEEEVVDTFQLMRVAEEAYQEEDWASAQKYYEALVRLVPTESQFWFKLGNVYVRRDVPDLAVGAFKEAVVRDPQLTKAWFNMGVVQLRQTANTFLQMKVHSEEGTSDAATADVLYQKIIDIMQPEDAAQ